MKLKNAISLFCGVIVTATILAGCSFLKSNTPHAKLESVPDHSHHSFTIHGRTIDAEVVNTEASVTQGLSGRSELGADAMLFIFSRPEYQRFWMKDMRFDLDMIWMNDLKITGISQNVSHPLPSQSLTQLPVFASNEKVNEVLEVPAGTVQMWQLKVGDAFVPSE